MSLLYFAVCFFGWGFAIFIMTIVGKSLNHHTIVVCNLFGYILMNVYAIPKAKLEWTFNHGLAVIVGSLFVISNIAYYKLSEMGGQASVLGPLTGLYVIVPVILGVLFLGEPLSARKCLGVTLAIAAIFLLAEGTPAAA